LLERQTELAALTSLIAATPGGGRLLAIEGPPGIGKTALMAIRCRTDGAPLSLFVICRPTVSPDATLERKSAARP
jgi:hypothetical protein